jgi:hypothetical protein
MPERWASMYVLLYSIKIKRFKCRFNLICFEFNFDSRQNKKEKVCNFECCVIIKFRATTIHNLSISIIILIIHWRCENWV